MIDGGRWATAADRRETADDPDAPWKPVGGDRLLDADLEFVADASDVATRAPSAWSREAVESPVPTIDEISDHPRSQRAPDVRRPAPASPAVVVEPAVETAPRSTVAGDVVLTRLTVAVVVAGALVVAWALAPRSDGAAIDTPSLPDAVNEAWVIDVGEGALVAISDDVVVAANAAGIDAYASDDATPLWNRAFEHGGNPVGIEVYDDVVVTVEQTSRTVVSLSGFASSDGTLLWSRPGAFSVVELPPGAPVEFSSPDWTTRLNVVDPLTGSRIGRNVEAVELSPPPHHALGRRDGNLVLFDLRTGARIGPSIAEFGLHALAPVGDRLVGFTDAANIVLYDGAGRAVDQRRFVSDAFGDFSGRAGLVGGVPGTSIGVVASGSSIGFDVATGAINVVWEIPGRVGPPVETEIGPVSVTRVVSEAGEVDLALVDPISGSTLVVTDVGATRQAPPTLAADGYIVAPVVGDQTRTISAHDFSGAEKWRLGLPRDAEFRLVDGTLYTISPDGTVVAHR